MSYEYNVPCDVTDYSIASLASISNGTFTCPEPYVMDANGGCTVTWASNYGASFIVLSIYTGALGGYTLYESINRFIKLYGMRAKNVKAWEGQGPLYFLNCLCSFLSVLVSIDPWGYRGWIPRGLNTIFADARIFCGYGLAILVIFQWMAIVGAKGASTDLALSMKILRNLALLCLFIADFICPPLAYVMIPAGGTNGLNNAKVSAFQYVVNAIVGISVSVGAAVYAFRIWNVMGGKAATAKFKSQSASGTINSQDADRMQKMNKVINNMLVMNSILGIAALYSFYLCVSRIGGCYIFYGPGKSLWFVIANVLEIIGPFCVLFVIALPGQKTGAKKLGDMISNASTAMSGKGRSTIKQSKTGGASTTTGSTTSNALSGHGKSEVSMMSTKDDAKSMMSTRAEDVDIEDPEAKK